MSLAEGDGLQSMSPKAVFGKSRSPVSLKRLKSSCDCYLKDLRAGKFVENSDYKQDIFEAALELFYGKKIWKEIAERSKI